MIPHSQSHRNLPRRTDLTSTFRGVAIVKTVIKAGAIRRTNLGGTSPLIAKNTEINRLLENNIKQTGITVTVDTLSLPRLTTPTSPSPTPVPDALLSSSIPTLENDKLLAELIALIPPQVNPNLLPPRLIGDSVTSLPLGSDLSMGNTADAGLLDIESGVMTHCDCPDMAGVLEDLLDATQKIRTGAQLITSDLPMGNSQFGTKVSQDAPYQIATDILDSKTGAIDLSKISGLPITHNTALPAGMDVGAFVQQVLRECYLEQNQILKVFAQKVRSFNDKKKRLRHKLTQIDLISSHLDEGAPLPEGFTFDMDGEPFVAFENDSTRSINSSDNSANKNTVETMNPKKMEAFRNAIEEHLKTVGEDAQLANLDLQNALQKQTQTMQMMSNISKVLHETIMSITRKIGG